MGLILGGLVRTEARQIGEVIPTTITPSGAPLLSLLQDGCHHPLATQDLGEHSQDSAMDHRPHPVTVAAAAMEGGTMVDTPLRRHRPRRTTVHTGTNITVRPRITTGVTGIGGRTETGGAIGEAAAAGITDSSKTRHGRGPSTPSFMNANAAVLSTAMRYGGIYRAV